MNIWKINIKQFLCRHKLGTYITKGRSYNFGGKTKHVHDAHCNKCHKILSKVVFHQ